MICTKCGTNLPDNAAFCTTCGTAVTQPVVEQPVMEQPVMEQPVMEQHVIEQPVMGQPMMQQPPMGQPMMQQPPMGQPMMQQPPMGQPMMQQPPMGQPMMQQPPMGQPMMQQPPIGQPMMQAPMGQPMMQPMMPPKKSKTPIIILGVSIAALIAIIVTVVILLFACDKGGGKNSSNSSAKAVTTALFEALADKNEKSFNKTIYPVILDMYSSEDYSYYDDIKEEFYELLEDYYDDTVKSFSVDKVTIEETEKADKEDLASANEYLKEMDGYKKMTYGATIYGTLDVTIKGESYELEFEMEIVSCDGTYYILDISDID